MSAGGFLRLASKVPVVDGSLPPAGWQKHVRRGIDGAYEAWVTRDWPSRAGRGSVRRHRVEYVNRDVAAAYAAAVASQRAVQAGVAAELCASRIQKWVCGFREALSASAAATAAARAVQACVAAHNKADSARRQVARIRSRARALKRTRLAVARLRSRQDEA